MRIKDHISDRVRFLMTILLAGAGVLALAACNTTEGAGKDIESLGESIQDAAN